MNRIFGTAKKVPPPSIVDAISSTDGRVDSVEVKMRKLDAELMKYREQMRTMREGPAKNAVKQKAMRVLKQKKLMTTENLKNTLVTVDAMKYANKELKNQYKKINITKIERMQDEMEDLMEQANDIQETLGRSYGLPEDLDEADLEAELDALGDELVEEDEVPSYLQEPTYTSELPGVSTEEPSLPVRGSKRMG
ncbi:Snf7-domain-containing protein [Blyttiomyces helicus]|uniref:Snf7-domain-containing protein n=1 Tax=Blyttiomyces helicus TaxID=388810 RepID=A0A4P9VXF8_9FUNG|nr:Snf7-domain-containing protein [Blyttiomyces helicus]|eukprot:RKO84421.1 Snf7-domain-containing protein [Blyttiomyces helicus]